MRIRNPSPLSPPHFVSPSLTLLHCVLSGLTGLDLFKHMEAMVEKHESLLTQDFHALDLSGATSTGGSASDARISHSSVINLLQLPKLGPFAAGSQATQNELLG